MPRWEEDCSVVITRLGTASLEATSVAGLGNEVASVTVFDTLAQGLGNDTNDPDADGARSGWDIFGRFGPWSTKGVFSMK
jgi:hypothetical protein